VTREHGFDAAAASVAASDPATASAAVAVSVTGGTTAATATGAAEAVVTVVDLVKAVVPDDAARFVAATDRFVTKYHAPIPIAANARIAIRTIGHLLDRVTTAGGAAGAVYWTAAGLAATFSGAVHGEPH